jgi:hypothetical protein
LLAVCAHYDRQVVGGDLSKHASHPICGLKSRPYGRRYPLVPVLALESVALLSASNVSTRRWQRPPGTPLVLCHLAIVAARTRRPAIRT